MHSFDYAAPTTLKQAVALLRRSGSVALAGGTDLLLRLQARQVAPRLVVDLKRITDFDALRFDARTGLHIGPAVTMAQLERSDAVRRHYPALAQGAEVVGSAQIRNRATLVGNLCNAAPSADTAPGLLALGARVRLAGPRGRRTVSLEDFLLGPGQTALKAGELVVGVQVPPPRPRRGSAYARHTLRQAMDIAVVGVAAVVALEPRRPVCAEVAIALGAVAPTPVRAPAAEAILLGQEPTPERVEAAARAAAEAAEPIDDVRASAAYRREIVRVLTERMVRTALEAARPPKGASRRTA